MFLRFEKSVPWSFALVFCLLCSVVLAQSPASKPADPIQRVSPNVFAIGSIRVDATKREVSVTGTVNPVTTLEFVACTKSGVKAYESALTLDTYAINFNAALLLIGLDAAHGHAPTRQFDPAVPQGDRVEIWVEGNAQGKGFRIPAEQLLFDRVAKKPVSGSTWVYTGSTFIPGDSAPRFLAELEGALIGFVHSPAPLIEQAGGSGVGRYGQIILNPDLGLTPDMPVTLTVKAVGPQTEKH